MQRIINKLMNGYVPKRRCIVCMQSKAKPELIKINPGMPGKGRYICDNEKCIELAIKKKKINREDLLNAKEGRNG